MKGSLHTDKLMAEVVRTDTRIRTVRRISQVLVMDVSTYPKPLFITDAALNTFPTLDETLDIAQSAIELAQALGIHAPEVAILSAVGTITWKSPSTIDAASSRGRDRQLHRMTRMGSNAANRTSRHTKTQVSEEEAPCFNASWFR